MSDQHEAAITTPQPMVVQVAIDRTVTGTTLAVKVTRPAVEGEPEDDAVTKTIDHAIRAFRDAREQVEADGLTLGKDAPAVKAL